MPEGDTIWRTAATLREGLEGKRVLAARPDALKRLAGTTVLAVKPYWVLRMRMQRRLRHEPRSRSPMPLHSLPRCGLRAFTRCGTRC